MTLSEAHLIHLLDREYDLLAEKEWIVSVHEAGHALICHLLNLGRVQEMRLDRAGGLTRVQMSPITGTLQTIQNLMVYHLAGRAAELIVLNQVTAGSGGNEDSDLAKATSLALQIERALGLGANDLLWEAASHPAQCRPMSMTERTIISGHLTAAQSHAVSLLQANVTSLVKLAKRLAIKRHLESEEIEAMLRQSGLLPIG